MLFRSLKLIVFFIFCITLLGMSACSGGSGGSGGSDDPPLQLSVSSAKPGHFISVEHDSIVADSQSVLEVYYPDIKETLNLKSVYSDSGVARFVVPPFFDSNKKIYTSGKVTLRLADTSAASDFQIESPTDLGTTQPGYVMAWMMKLSRDKYASAIDRLEAKALGVDVSNLKAQLTDHIALLDASIAEIETMGQLTMVMDDGTVYVLGADELGQNDLLLFSIAEGFALEYQNLAPSPSNTSKASTLQGIKTISSVSRTDVNMDDLPPHVREALEKTAEGLRWASDNGGKLGAGLLGAVGIVVTIKAGVIGLPIIFLGAVGYVIVDGAIGEGLNSLADKLDSNNSGGYKFGDQLLESAEESLQNMLLSLGGAKSKVVDFIGTLWNAKSIHEAFGIEKCDALEQPDYEPEVMKTASKSMLEAASVGEEKFCAGLETSGLSVPVAGPMILAPGEAGGWAYAIYGGSAPHHLLVNWGDGAETNRNDAGTSGALSHTYTDNGQYVINLNATSNDGDTGSAATLVWVESADSLSATITIDDYLTNYNFRPVLAFAGFGSISGSDEMDEIPTVIGYRGGLGTSSMEVLSIMISKYIDPSNLPYVIEVFSDDIDDFIVDEAQVMMNYSTPDVTDETGDGSTGSHVVFSAVGGTMTIEEYGNQLGDRISGHFNVQLRGERDLCPDKPECDENAEQIIEGTAVGEFSGVLKLEENFFASSTH